MKEEKSKLKLITVILTFLSLLMVFGCATQSESLLNPQQDFHFILKYGVGAKNIINTFNDTYTKDMVVDSSLTIKLSLSDSDLDTVRKAFNKIDIFDYPDPYQPRREDTYSPEEVTVTPYATYDLYIQIGEHIKTIHWEDSNLSRMKKAIKLRDVIRMIKEIVENKMEVKNLPTPRGGYL